MKRLLVILIGCLAVALVHQFRGQYEVAASVQVPEPQPAISDPEVQFLELSAPEPEPMIPTQSAVQEMIEPEAVETPAQSVEERGDAMLFEIDALGGLPFDQSITMPFD